jgi:VWFA-related protein
MKVVISLGLLLALMPLRGDDGTQPEPRLIDLNVIAVDAHGEPVIDLTSDDFQVTDGGKPQKIAFFRHTDSKLWRQPALGPNEFSNRSGANIPRATVILFDLLNERLSTRGAAQSQLTHYLESLETADYLYLYLLTVEGRLYSVRGLPIGEAPVSSSAAPWTREIKPLLDGAMRTVMRVRPVDIDVAVRVQLTFQALDMLAVELSHVPGRKNIVWITDGVPIALGPVRSDTGDFVDYTPLIRRLTEALDRSAIAIYPVRQVMLGSPDAINAGGGGGVASIDTLEQFAGLTGGRPDAGKDVGGAIKQAMNDVRISYQIGYYPPSGNWDGKFHKLRVASRRKGLRLQAKTGYYAWPDPPGTRAQQAVAQAVATAFDAAEIGLRASLAPEPKEARLVQLNARVDANDIVLAHDADQYTGQLRFAIASYPADGPPQLSTVIPLDLHYTAQERDRAFEEGIPFSQEFQLPVAARTVRLIVFDRGSNAVGSITVPFTVN